MAAVFLVGSACWDHMVPSAMRSVKSTALA